MYRRKGQVKILGKGKEMSAAKIYKKLKWERVVVAYKAKKMGEYSVAYS